MLKSFLGVARRGWWLVPVIVPLAVTARSSPVHAEDGDEAFMFHVADQMAQCSAGYGGTAASLGEAGGEEQRLRAKDWKLSSEIVAVLAANDWDLGQEFADDRKEAHAESWALRMEEAKGTGEPVPFWQNSMMPAAGTGTCSSRSTAPAIVPASF